MDFPRCVDDMRTRTALLLFLISLVLGGLLTFALASLAAGGGSEPSPRTLVGQGDARTEITSSGARAIAWRDFDSGLKEAKAKKKRVVVDVYTDWCGWCKRMERDTYSHPDVRKYVGKAFVAIRLNAESNARASYKGTEYSCRQLAAGFGVRGYPTTLFLESDGTHITTAPGYMGAQDFLSVLRYVGDGHYKTKDFDQYRAEQQGSGSPESAAR